jgi:hypothetical protein
VVTGRLGYDPKITNETYIDEDNASITIDGYAPTFPIDMVARVNDPPAVFEFIDSLRKSRAILEDAETEICNVLLYQTPAGGYYYAEKQAVSIQVEDFGGEGGSPARINYTINFLGDPVSGIFKPAAPATFEANPITTVLTTMVIGTAVLIPLFADDHSNLLYTSSVINEIDEEVLTSTLAGADIVQKVGVTEVNQSAAAALAVGLNHITIEVTVGEEVSTYRVDITRAAA